MGYTNSPLVDLEILSPNYTDDRENITKITVHHVCGMCSCETLGNIFLRPERQASCNYAIGNDTRVVLIVPEKYRSWCSSSSWNDRQAITIEVADYQDENGAWCVTDEIFEKLIDLLVDICERNDIKELYFTGDRDGNYTWHSMFIATDCPGDWGRNRTNEIINRVNERLNAQPQPQPQPQPQTDDYFRVCKRWSNDFAEREQIGAYTIYENAVECCDKNEGYYVFDSSGDVVYPYVPDEDEGYGEPFPQYSDEDLANAIWYEGREPFKDHIPNGQERRDILGARYDAVQEKIAELFY